MKWIRPLEFVLEMIVALWVLDVFFNVSPPNKAPKVHQ